MAMIVPGASVSGPQTKYDATAAPTVNDDETEGYAVGSRWVDVTHGKAYTCLDATDGAAVWTETTQSGGEASPLGAFLGRSTGNKWRLPGWSVHNTIYAAVSWTNYLVYTPIFVRHARTFTRIGALVGVVGAEGETIRLGIYSAKLDNDNYLVPDALVVDAGTIPLDDGTGTKEIIISEALDANSFYFLARATAAATAAELDVPYKAEPVSSPITSYGSTPGAVQSMVMAAANSDAPSALPDPATPVTLELPCTHAFVFLRD